MANVLGLSELCSNFPLKFDNIKFTVKFPNQTINFKQVPNGLFYYDTGTKGFISFTQLFGTIHNVYSIMITVHTSEGFSNHSNAMTRTACRLQTMLDHPSSANLIYMVHPVSVCNKHNATHIFCGDIASTRARLPGRNLNLLLLITLKDSKLKETKQECNHLSLCHVCWGFRMFWYWVMRNLFPLHNSMYL